MHLQGGNLLFVLLYMYHVTMEQWQLELVAQLHIELRDKNEEDAFTFTF